MYLKEFEFDLPYQKNLVTIEHYQKSLGLPLEEAQRMDYQENWKSKRHSFRAKTRCISSMLERMTLPIKNEWCKKVIFECYSGSLRDATVKNISGFLHIPVVFDLDTFEKSDDYKKKRMLVQAIVDSSEKIRIALPFCVDEILIGCEKIVQNNYKNEWVWKETRKSKNGYARVRITHDCEEAKIFLDYLALDSSVLRTTLVATCAPDEWDYANYLGKLIRTQEEIVLISKTGERVSYPLV